MAQISYRYQNKKSMHFELIFDNKIYIWKFFNICNIKNKDKLKLSYFMNIFCLIYKYINRLIKID